MIVCGDLSKLHASKFVLKVTFAHDCAANSLTVSFTPERATGGTRPQMSVRCVKNQGFAEFEAPTIPKKQPPVQSYQKFEGS